MKLAALQMVSTPDVDRNLKAADRLIADAAAQGATLASLPEYFCLMGENDRDKLRIAENDGSGPIQEFLSSQAKSRGLWLIGGTLPIRALDGARVRNACCVYGPNGERAARYDKLHLFAFDNGREHYDEAVALEPGDSPVAVQAGDLRVGLSVCYDLRFPELYRAMSFESGQKPCDVISVPAAFTYTTGKAHWELLLRTRAVENQCYVVAAAQGGKHENGRRTWGHSMVIDPWGEVLAVVEEGEGIAIAEFSPERMGEVRVQLPALGHRRI
ncbi:carbon-nitrogen hydrolase family protein [Azohydromonas lata]|uniref:Carbon-nitrogen hydrolase family protein n=1 Tax=Azohydromonas lata TaxID=45677 RepID=A0ABU5IB89_9BURK|nr:carbon-nitrogen hydrolase family protein [Azohydromonas lata]MDZ5456364.1 carbon-nitrogen hydrolase family protein [Azohydromonas lata]